MSARSLRFSTLTKLTFGDVIVSDPTGLGCVGFIGGGGRFTHATKLLPDNFKGGKINQTSGRIVLSTPIFVQHSISKVLSSYDILKRVFRHYSQLQLSEHVQKLTCYWAHMYTFSSLSSYLFENYA